MTRSSIVFFCFSLVFCFACLPAARGESVDKLICNGGFSRGLDGWTVRFDAPTETKYAKNHHWVEAVRRIDGARSAIRFSLTPSVAASEGVKASTPLISVKAGESYEFGCRIKSFGPRPKVILEGYREDPGRTAAGADQYPGYKRVYRAVIHPKGVSREWSEHTRVVAPPVRYQPTHVLIKLYAYLGTGDIFFTDVFLRQVVKNTEP